MVTKTKRNLVGVIVVILVMGPFGAAYGISATSKDSTAMEPQVQTAALANSTKVKATSIAAKKIPKTETRIKNRGSERGMLLTVLVLLAGQQGSRR